MNSTEVKTIQGVASTGLVAISCYLNALFIPVMILVVVMILDYITGMTVAWNSGGLSRKKGIKGIDGERSASDTERTSADGCRACSKNSFPLIPKTL